MGRPAADPARDTRRQILDAALSLFAERGYHAASMRALAAAVGVRESALYHHFASKEAILTAIIDEQMSVRVSLIDSHAVLSEDLELEDLLMAMVGALLALLQTPRQRQFMRFMISEGGRLVGEDASPLRDMIVRPRRAITQLFQRLRKAGKIRGDVDVEVFAAHLAAPVIFVSDLVWGEGNSPFQISHKRFLREHVEFLIAAMAPHRGR